MAIRLDPRELVKGLDELRARAIPGAIRRALTRSLNSGRTAMARDVAADMGLKVGYVKEQIQSRVTGSIEEGFSGELRVSGKRIPLIQFGAKGPEPSRGRGRGVTAKVSGGRGRYPNAFITTMQSGHRGVFQRVPGASVRQSRGAWSKNLPIVELRGASLPHVFDKKRDVAIARFTEQFVKELQHEVSYALQQVASS